MIAITRNAAGMLVSPVVANAVGITPAATVSGATPPSTKNSTAGMPSRSLASARETAPGLPGAVWVWDISGYLLRGWGLYAVGEHGSVDRCLGLGDDLAQFRGKQ